MRRFLETLTRSVRATAGERARTLPGDDLIETPVGSLQHAIAIRGAHHQVWPWLVQMGAGTRAGWYSYDVLDNGGRPSARRIVPEVQRIEIGMSFPAVPGATDGFSMRRFEPARFLVLGLLTPQRVPLMTWAFVLEDAAPESTRLIVRARAGAGYRFFGLPWWLVKPLAAAVHFAMQRKQLLGIARRAEQKAGGEAKKAETEKGTGREVSRSHE